MKSIAICISALAGIVLCGCAYDDGDGRYAYSAGYYGKYGENGYYGPNGYAGRFDHNHIFQGRSRYYTVDGVLYDCLSKFDQAYCGSLKQSGPIAMSSGG